MNEVKTGPLRRSGWLSTRLALVAVVALLVPFIQAAPAEACTQYSQRNHVNQANHPSATFWMGDSVPKANTGCSDVNVWTANHSAFHRGQYFDGVWRFSNVGSVWVASGSTGWRVVVGNVLATTPVRAGSTERHRWWSSRWSTWRV